MAPLVRVLQGESGTTSMCSSLVLSAGVPGCGLRRQAGGVMQFAGAQVATSLARMVAQTSERANRICVSLPRRSGSIAHVKCRGVADRWPSDGQLCPEENVHRDGGQILESSSADGDSAKQRSQVCNLAQPSV